MIPTELNWESLWLSSTWLLPLLGAGFLAMMPWGAAGSRRFALGVNALNLLSVAALLYRFWSYPPPQDAKALLPSLAFAVKIPWWPSLGVDYFVGVDGLSLLMMLLAALIAFSGTLASWELHERPRLFFALLLALAGGVFGAFISFDAFTFFVFNELTLIPTYLLIALYGSGRREFAAMKLTLMLLAGSALILGGLLGLRQATGLQTFDIFALASGDVPVATQAWIFAALFLGFGLLGNLFPLHLWSPDGHASAPTAVSMFLAGVHMKLGSYGCLRFAIYLLPEGAQATMAPFLVLAAIGVLWGAFVALRQRDLKYLNAYSSVSHCAAVVLGLTFLNAAGLRGAVMQMLAHGLVTAAMFCLIGAYYHRTHTRDLDALGGLRASAPWLAGALILTGFAAVGLPGFASFVAELNIFLGGMAGSPLAKAGAAAGLAAIVVAAIYMLRAVNGILHGPPAAKPIADATWAEKAALFPLLGLALIIGLWPGPWMRIIDAALQPILNQLAR